MNSPVDKRRRSDEPQGLLRLVVLGAGQPPIGESHPSLRSTTGRSRVLDWLLQAVAWLKPRLIFVGGYQMDQIVEQYPDFHYTINPEWANTGPAASFLGMELDDRCIHYVSYADILFRDTLVRRMEETDADVVVAADTKWRSRFEGRTQQDISRCEKLNLVDLTVTRLGPDIDPEMADAEFVGLARFSHRAIRFLNERLTFLADKLRKARLSELIEVLRVCGLVVHAVDVSGDWAELNEPQDLARFVLGTKAQTLHRLQVIVTQSQIEEQISFTVGEWSAGMDEVLAGVQNTFDGRSLVVRSSALSEDSFTSANAGAYSSVLNVDSSNIVAIREAIEAVVASYPDKNPHNQVLVQPMVGDVVASGVAFSRTLTYGAPYYVINYDDVSHSTESITSGASREHKTFVLHRNGLTSASQPLPSIVRALVVAIREIEELLDFDSLDIEFAINGGGVVHILQVRPIVVDHQRWEIADEEIARLLDSAKTRFLALQKPSPFTLGEQALFGVMPDWNPAEIIGTKPGRLAMTLYRYLIMDEIWATQRCEYGYRDVRPQPLLVAFAGHPYVDVRASFSSFIPNALPEDLARRLVSFYIGWLEAHPHLHDKVEFEVVPTCFDLDFERWAKRLTADGRFSSNDINCLENALRSITAQAFGRPQSELASITRLEERFRQIMATPLEPLDRGMVLLEDCRRYGTLAFSHLARGAFVAVTLLRSAVRKCVISQEAMDAFLKSIRTVTHMFTHDATAVKRGELEWEAFVAKYGHLRPGTYDITSQKYADDPERYLRPIIEKASDNYETEPDPGPWREARVDLSRALVKNGISADMDTVESFMRNAIEGREYSKFSFSRNLSAALDCLVDFGNSVGLGREDLFHLPIDAFLTLRTGTVITADPSAWLRQRAEEGRRERRVSAAVELPPLLTCESDFEAFFYPNTQPNFIGSGRIVADCADLSNFTSGGQPRLGGMIVIIPQADPGYDWLFGQGIGGLITTYGGANSHMAIRAAEFGLPAAIGIGEAKYGRLAHAAVLELDADNRQIRVIR